MGIYYLLLFLSFEIHKNLSDSYNTAQIILVFTLSLLVLFSRKVASIC